MKDSINPKAFEGIDMNAPIENNRWHEVVNNPNKLPIIEWERGELIDTDDHIKWYALTGESEDGRKWSATLEVVDNHDETVVDIEEI